MHKVSKYLIFSVGLVLVFLGFIYHHNTFYAITVSNGDRVENLRVGEDASFKLKVAKDYVDAEILYEGELHDSISFDAPGVYVGDLVYDGFSKSVIFKVGNANILKGSLFSNYADLNMYFKDESGRVKIRDAGRGVYDIPFKDGALYIYKDNYSAFKIADIHENVIVGVENFVDFRRDSMMIFNIERDLIQ